MTRDRGLSLLFAVVAFGFLGLALQRMLAGVQAGWLSAARIDWLLLSLAGVLGLIVGMAALWRRLVQLLQGGRLPAGLALHLHLLGWLGRYIPGKVAGMVGKVLLAEARGYPRVPLAAATTYEQLYFFATGAALALPLLLPLPLAARLALSTAALGATALAFAGLLPLLSPLLTRLQRETVHLPRLGWRTHLGLTALYLLPHAAVGLGFWLFLLGLGLRPLDPLQAIAVLTAAHVAGMAAVFAPAGVGAREAALTALLLPSLPLDQALAVAGLTRLWATAGDALAGLYSAVYAAGGVRPVAGGLQGEQQVGDLLGHQTDQRDKH